MSKRNRYTLILVLVAFSLAAVWIYHKMGAIPERQAPPPTLLPPPVRSVAPMEAAQAPSYSLPDDELSDYQSCPGQNQQSLSGRGSFNEISGHYDKEGRYVFFIDLEGETGFVTISEELARRSRNVTFLDFKGDFRISRYHTTVEGPGRLNLVRLGVHRGFRRVSFNYKNNEAPQSVKVELKCKSDR
ncbi:MAG: hypothetical protein LBE27_05390, partial [Deltaproteobacteria bacterium]|nr:hypothetical protein [Deltaproteobacteria bacterium]